MSGLPLVRHRSAVRNPRNPIVEVPIQAVAEMVQFTEVHQVPGTTVTVATLHLLSGYQVHGDSSCADPARFDRAEGERRAIDKALRRLVELETYRRSFVA